MTELNRIFSKGGIKVANRYIKLLNITNRQGQANLKHTNAEDQPRLIQGIRRRDGVGEDQ